MAQPRTQHTPKQIMRKLPDADAMLSAGKTIYFRSLTAVP